MASFVREVLSATGTLGDKENFPGKIVKIQKKLHDLKSTLQNHIHSKYTKFATNLNDASSITAQMEDLHQEIETINNNINNHLKPDVGNSNQELIQLTEQIHELNLTLQTVNKIKMCYEAIEEGNEMVRDRKWLAASESLSKGLELIRRPTTDLGEDENQVKVLPALKQEMVRQQQKLLVELSREWKQNIIFTSNELENKLDIKLELEQAGQLLQALNLSELLEEHLIKLNKNLKKFFLELILGKNCRLSMDNMSLTITQLTSDETPVPSQVFQQVKEMFSFLCIHLESDDRNSSLMSLLSPLLAPWLSDQLVRKVLAPAVPTEPEHLHTYEEIINQTEEIHEYLVSIGVLPSTDLTILNYARNVDAISASKMCETLLSTAREIMKKDLYLSQDVTPAPLTLNEHDPSDQLPIPPNFPLPESCFQFPKCQISSSALELLDLANKGLDHAAQSKQLCSVRLFHTVRNMFSLWCAVTPTYHKTALESLPQVAALAHNSAMYLAHHMVTLGFSHRDKLGDKVGQTITVDLVPRLRGVGADMLLASMRLQRDNLKQILQTAGFPNLAVDRRLSTGVEQGVKQVLHTLTHLQKVWYSVLPTNTYLRCIGTLLNTVLEEIILIITNLEDISADAGGQLVSLLNQIVAKSPLLFSPEIDQVGRYVKRWSKFRELILVLGATLRDIEDRWACGKLAEEFPADQVKQLVRALFQNTERRAAVLAKIK